MFPLCEVDAAAAAAAELYAVAVDAADDFVVGAAAAADAADAAAELNSVDVDAADDFVVDAAAAVAA